MRGGGHILVLLRSGAVQRVVETNLHFADARELAEEFQREHPSLGVMIDAADGTLLEYLPPLGPLPPRSREPLTRPDPILPDTADEATPAAVLA